MDHLWAPWRMPFITKVKGPNPGNDCFLCRGLGETDDRTNLIAWRRPHCVVVLNRYPYNNGHLLIAPLAHKANLEDLSVEEGLEIFDTIRHLVSALQGLIKPHGFNIGLNLGAAAGAGLPGHLHWHIVPRWNGDTNFMSAIADTHVISQSLEALYDLLTPELQKA